MTAKMIGLQLDVDIKKQPSFTPPPQLGVSRLSDRPSAARPSPPKFGPGFRPWTQGVQAMGTLSHPLAY
jgi:hypothetical protein